MDLFGKKAQQEFEHLQKRMNDLEVRYSDMVAKHARVSEELQESLSLVATINAANKSKALHYDEKREHDQKAAEFVRKCNEIATRETVLKTAYENKSNLLTKEIKELEGKVSDITAALSDSRKRAGFLENEIQANERKRDSVVAEIEKLKVGRLNAETELIEAQVKWFEITGAVDKLTKQQEIIANSNLYLNQVVSHLNRHGDKDTIFASLEHDLHRFLDNDRASGAVQVELKARPLLLVVDFGYDTLNFATVRAGLISGGSEISLQLESRKIEQGMGCSRFETLLAGWVWKRFTAIHPRLKESVKEEKGVELSLPTSQRLLALLCQGAPQGEVEETIVTDSETFSVSIPLMREELVSVFLPLLGPDGELTGAIRRFLAEFKLSVDAIDRTVCMGWHARLPFLGGSLREVIKRQVLIAEPLPTDAPIEPQLLHMNSKKKQVKEKPHGNVDIVRSDPEREKREWEKKELKEREERVQIECEARELDKRKQLELKAWERTAREKKGRETRFKIIGDVMVDTSTGLMWARNANLVKKGTTWEEGNKWAANLKYAGYNDWRLPNLREFKVFEDLYGRHPWNHLNSIGFINVRPYFYWTRNCHPSDHEYGITVCLGSDDDFDDTDYGCSCVWPVRTENRNI